MNKFFLQFSSVAAVTLLLVSCGGGGGGTNDAVADTRFADCFALDVGRHYSMGDFTSRRVDEKVFNGQTLRGVTELWAGVPDWTEYVEVSGGYVNFPGRETYGANPTTVLIPGLRFPDNMSPGDAANLNYQRTTLPAGTIETEGYTTFFVGFETLTLAGRTFTDTCHFRTPDDLAPGESYHIWFAKGFGTIREEQQDAQGNLVDTSTQFTGLLP